jgi:amino acid transporter
MVKASSTKRCLGVFQLVMIAIISVDSLRNLPIIAQYGFPLITFLVFAGVFFFFPLTWVSSQLAVRYPHSGGSYLWVEAAFGKTFGYLAIWLLWIYNIIWYPTIFVFISSIIATLVFPSYASNHWFILISCASLFWFITFLHSYGVHFSAKISTISAIGGTLFPMLLIIVLAVYWLLSGSPSAISMSFSDLLPNPETFKNLAYFSNFLFGLMGIEIIAMQASNVINPQKAYPRAFLISAPIILITMLLSSLALCIVVPPKQIGLISGIMDAFKLFFMKYFPAGTVIIGWCIVIGGLGIASSWMIGLARGLHVAFQGTNVPKPLQKLNKNGVPLNILIFQGIIYTCLLSAFLLLPNINSSYWLLSALTAQFALIYYVLLFLAAIKLLRDRKQTSFRAFLNYAIPLTAGVVSIAGIIVGFIPPAEIQKNNIFLFECFMVGSLFVFCSIPFLILNRKKSQTP